MLATNLPKPLCFLCSYLFYVWEEAKCLWTPYTHLFQRFSRWLLIQPTTNRKGSLNRNLLFCSWLMIGDGVEHRNVLSPTTTLSPICQTINKRVYYQHLLFSFEELLSLRLSDPFALIVGWINNRCLNLIYICDDFRVFVTLYPCTNKPDVEWIEKLCYQSSSYSQNAQSSIGGKIVPQPYCKLAAF